MTISTTTNRVTYTGNGATVAFSFPYAFFAKADLVVIETIIATGVQTTKTLTTHYTISGSVDALGHYSSGGTVTAVTAPASTVTWTIYRDPTATQTTDLVENDPMPAESIEAALDYQTMLVQRLTDLMGRSLRQPDGDVVNIGALPSKFSRASAYLAFDANGEPVASAAGLDTTTVSTFMATVLDDTSAAAARATLGAISAAEAITPTIMSAKGDLLGATGNDTPAVKTVGANGSVLMARSEDASGLAYVPALTKAIYGLTYANGTDAVNDININAGGAMDATGAYWMTLGTALGKQSDVAWAVGGTTGTPAGGLDTGAVGDNDYYLWLIARSDTGVVDALFSLSATSPTMPANYDYKRLMGWVKRTGGTIVAMHTYETEGGGLELLWDSPTLDINLANTLTTTRRTDAVKVPLNFSTTANLNVNPSDSGAGHITYIYCPDLTDLAPSATAAPLLTFNANAVAVSNSVGGNLRVRTSATGTIAARSNLATVDLYAVSTVGFTWARRN